MAGATRLLLHGGHVVSFDAAVGDHPDCDVLIEGHHIAAVGPDLRAGASRDTQVIDARGTLVLPGFVDTHRHTWTALLRGQFADQTLAGYQAALQGPLAAAIGPGDLFAGTLLGAWEALNAGVTTVLDYAHLNPTREHAEAGIEALRHAGIRACYAHGSVFGLTRGWGVAEQEPYVDELLGRHFGDGDRLLSFWLAFGNPYGEADWATAARLGVRSTVHACIRSAGEWPAAHTVKDLAVRGLLAAGTVYSHCCIATDEELQLIAGSGGYVSSSPYLEMVMGHGAPIVARALAAGLRPTFGADSLANGPGDMFTQMRAALATTRLAATPADPDAPFEPAQLPPGRSTRQILELATAAGATACGLDGVTGTLTPGKQADIVVIRLDQPNTMPARDPIGTVVANADVSNVDTVIVAGKVRKLHGELVGLDLPELHRLVDDASRRLADAAPSPAR